MPFGKCAHSIANKVLIQDLYHYLALKRVILKNLPLPAHYWLVPEVTSKRRLCFLLSRLSCLRNHFYCLILLHCTACRRFRKPWGYLAFLNKTAVPTSLAMLGNLSDELVLNYKHLFCYCPHKRSHTISYNTDDGRICAIKKFTSMSVLRGQRYSAVLFRFFVKWSPAAFLQHSSASVL